MKLAWALMLLVVVAMATEMEDKQKWIEFKEKYNKRFLSSSHESNRFAVFQQSLRRAEVLQALNPDGKFGVTKFSDLTKEEFHRRFLTFNLTAAKLNYRPHSTPSPEPEALPTHAKRSTTWGSGRVTAVKDQGQCGSCWTFSAVGVIEGCYGKSNTIKQFSEQEILDCMPDSGGCDGGDPRAAIVWAGGHGLMPMSSYAYKGYAGTCSQFSPYYGTLSSSSIGSAGTTESAISTSLTRSPVSVAIDADVLQDYVDGVISSVDLCSQRSVNHAVLLVGDDGAFKIKNSWGANWGENGYFRIALGQDCLGITEWATKGC